MIHKAVGILAKHRLVEDVDDVRIGGRPHEPRFSFCAHDPVQEEAAFAGIRIRRF
jgi:hypothetical protein